MKWLDGLWYRSRYVGLACFLLPLSWLFRMVVVVRYYLYRWRIFSSVTLPVPVIIVGNLAVGGTGKTPLVIWLAHRLMQQGYRPGIVTRGVGGQKHRLPCWVNAASCPRLVGDEAVLLAKRTACPVVIGRDRVSAAQALLAQAHCDIIIADDGLQHYRLGRTIELVVVDSARQFGNRQLLPAGPLREPLGRLRHATLLVGNGGPVCWPILPPVLPAFIMRLQGDICISVQMPDKQQPLAQFNAMTVHALAGIGNPERFFQFLRQLGIQVIPHAYPDHYQFQRDDIIFPDTLPVLMTEKDAVKCQSIADERHWFIPVTAQIEGALEETIKHHLATAQYQ